MYKNKQKCTSTLVVSQDVQVFQTRYEQEASSLCITWMYHCRHIHLPRRFIVFSLLWGVIIIAINIPIDPRAATKRPCVVLIITVMFLHLHVHVAIVWQPCFQGEGLKEILATKHMYDVWNYLNCLLLSIFILLLTIFFPILCLNGTKHFSLQLFCIPILLLSWPQAHPLFSKGLCICVVKEVTSF